MFGRANFVCNVVWQKKYAPQSNTKWISQSHDHILLYANNKEMWSSKLLPRSEKMRGAYKNPDKDPRGAYKADNFTTSLTGGQRGAQFARTGFSANLYEIVTPSGRKVLPPKGTCWRYSKERYEELLKDNRVWFGFDGNNTPPIKGFCLKFKTESGHKPFGLEMLGRQPEAKREVIAFNGQMCSLPQNPKNCSTCS